MTSGSYIWIGAAAAVLAALCLGAAIEGVRGEGFVLIAGIVLAVAGQFLLLVGVIGFGVALGIRDSGVAR